MLDERPASTDGRTHQALSAGLDTTSVPAPAPTVDSRFSLLEAKIWNNEGGAPQDGWSNLSGPACPADGLPWKHIICDNTALIGLNFSSIPLTGKAFQETFASFQAVARVAECWLHKNQSVTQTDTRILLAIWSSRGGVMEIHHYTLSTLLSARRAEKVATKCLAQGAKLLFLEKLRFPVCLVQNLPACRTDTPR